MGELETRMSLAAGAVPSRDTARRVRLAYVVSHPIQYQAPLLRRIAREPDIALTVLYGSDFSVRGYKDEGFGVGVKWDVPLLDGYNHGLPPQACATETTRQLRQPAQPRHPLRAARPRICRTARIRRALGPRLLHRQRSSRNPRRKTPRPPRPSARRVLAARPRPHSRHARAQAPLLLRSQARRSTPFSPSAPSTLTTGATISPKLRSSSCTTRSTIATSPIAPSPPIPTAARFRPSLASTPRVLSSSSPPSFSRASTATISSQPTHASCPHLASSPIPISSSSATAKSAPPSKQQAAATGFSSIRFCGFRNQSELPRFFDLATVFVLPSRHEPWGLIVNEVMNAARPVIVSDDVGCAPDLITDGCDSFIDPDGCIYLVGDVVSPSPPPSVGVLESPAAAKAIKASAPLSASRPGASSRTFKGAALASPCPRFTA